MRDLLVVHEFLDLAEFASTLFAFVLFEKHAS
jgi:hypothetical protein